MPHLARTTPRPPGSKRFGRKRHRTRHSKLESIRGAYDSHWQDIADHLLPRRIKLQRENRSRAGTKKNQKIINSSATQDLRTLASGMMAGITSPARPWFKLVTPDPQMMERKDVREWLSDTEDRMRTVFARSNLYNALPLVYTDLPAFGNSVMLVEENFDTVIRCKVFPIGSYTLATDENGRVNTVYYRIWMTIEQIVEKFSIENVSMSVARAYRNEQYDDEWGVVFVVEPNREIEPGALGAEGKRWIGSWYEDAGRGGKVAPEQGSADIASDKLLGMTGYDEFPIMAPRWTVTGENTYGDCPGMDALPDIKGLQHMEKRLAQALDKIVNPPMSAPVAMQTQRTSLLPGEMNYRPNTGQGKFEPAFIIDSRIQMLEGRMDRIERRIGSVFMADLFLMLAQQPMRSGTTAREVEERHEEKMLQLGPTLERIQDELLRPLIDRTFSIMVRFGMIEEPPKVLKGVDLRVEHISILAQAQKLLSTVAVERVIEFVARSGEIHQEALDKLDFDEAIDIYAELNGTPPKMVRSDEDVARLREMRAQQQAEAQQAAEGAAAMKDAAQAAKNLADTSVSGDNALATLLSPAA